MNTAAITCFLIGASVGVILAVLARIRERFTPRPLVGELSRRQMKHVAWKRQWQLNGMPLAVAGIIMWGLFSLPLHGVRWCLVDICATPPSEVGTRWEIVLVARVGKPDEE